MSETGYKGFFVEWIEQWSQFFDDCNWYTFHPIKVEYEDDRALGDIELTVIVLGLGFRAVWNHTETDTVKNMKREIDQIMNTDPTP